MTDAGARVGEGAGSGLSVTPGDAVTAPGHYTYSPIQPWDVIEAWQLDFFLGNAAKYLCRRGRKPRCSEREDLEKLIACVQKRIAQLDAPTPLVDHLAQREILCAFRIVNVSTGTQCGTCGLAVGHSGLCEVA